MFRMLRKTDRPDSGLGARVWIAPPGALGHMIELRLCMMEEHEGCRQVIWWRKNMSILSNILTLMNMIQFLWQMSVKLKSVYKLGWTLNRDHVHRGEPEIEEPLVEPEQNFTEKGSMVSGIGCEMRHFVQVWLKLEGSNYVCVMALASGTSQ